MVVKDYSAELKRILSHEKWLMNLLRAVRALDLPDWYLAAGVIRNTVWDVLHGYDKRTPLNDIDVVYFDREKKVHEKLAEKRLKELFPKYRFELVNQAFVHEIYHYKKQARSSCEAIGSFVEFPTCVGVRLEKDDSFTLCVPRGLDHLFQLHIAPIPEANLEKYKERMQEKQWKKIWPKLQVD